MKGEIPQAISNRPSRLDSDDIGAHDAEVEVLSDSPLHLRNDWDAFMSDEADPPMVRRAEGRRIPGKKRYVDLPAWAANRLEEDPVVVMPRAKAADSEQLGCLQLVE